MNVPRVLIDRFLKDYRLLALLALAVSLAVFIAYRGWHSDIETTDNATVRCDVTDVAAEVRGVIQDIYFTDNQTLNRGAPLMKLNDLAQAAVHQRSAAEFASAQRLGDIAVRDSEVARIDSLAQVEKAEANMESIQSRVEMADFELQEARSGVDIARSKFENQEAGVVRARQLIAEGFVTSKYLEDALHEQRKAEGELKIATARIGVLRSRLKSERSLLKEARLVRDQARNTVQARLESAQALAAMRQEQVSVARATLTSAEVVVSQTNIKAPRTGAVTNRRVSVGQFVEVGQPLVSITSCAERVWVEANFKESQIRKIIPGQKVSISVDTYPGEMVIGRVESISNGSGSLFSVLPPENATGNFTKVVQRFPVQINIQEGYRLMLRAGMSAVVKVHISNEGWHPDRANTE